MTSDAWAQRTNSDFLVDFYRLNSEIDAREGQTVHRKIVSDPSRGIRRAEHVETWSRLRELGHGGFGTVYLEKSQKDGKQKLRAVKELRKNFHRNQGQEFLRELMHMAYFSKDQACFPDFQGWFEDDQTIYLAMEYFEHGDLWQCVKTPLPERETQHIIFQVTEALIMLHSKDISHRDLKPENVFVLRKGPDWWVKLGDFGISKRVKGDETALYTRYLGPYIAPEVNEYLDLDDDDDDASTGTYTSAVDIWSLGCLAYWLLSRQTPFHAPKSLGRYCKGKIPLPVDPIKARLSDVGLAFVQGCLIVRPTARPSAGDAINLPWLREVSKMAFIMDSNTEPGPIKDSSVKDAKVNDNGHGAAPQSQPGAKSEDIARPPSASTKGSVEISTAIQELNNSLASVEDSGPSVVDAVPSPSGFHHNLEDTSSSIDRLSVQSMPGFYPDANDEKFSMDEKEQDDDDDDNDDGEHQDTVKARDKPVQILPKGPTINFTSIANTRGPSLLFPETRRTLPRPSSIIRVGRYSERHEFIEAMPTKPSDASISFKSKVVSRRHCEISYKSGHWYLSDVGSSSGTFLNDIRLSNPNIRSSPFPLKDGDRIQLGIDFRGGEEEFYRCVRIRVHCSGSDFPRSRSAEDLIAESIKSITSADISEISSKEKVLPDDPQAREELIRSHLKRARERIEAARTMRLTNAQTSQLSLESSKASDLASNLDDIEIAKALSLLDNEENSFNNNKALQSAILRGEFKLLKSLLNTEGGDSNEDSGHEGLKKLDTQDGSSGMSALHVAVLQDLSSALNLLIERGADIEARDTYEQLTALHMAARQGFTRSIGVLLDKGADIEAMTTDGLTPLHITAQQGHLEALRLLTSWGAKVSATTAKESTPLGLACEQGHERVVKYLVERKADLHHADSQGRTPLMLALSSQSSSIAKFLIDNGSELNVADANNNTPLMIAAKFGLDDVLIHLMLEGSDLEMRGPKWKTAMAIAKENNQKRTVEILKEWGAKETSHSISHIFRNAFSKK